MYFARHGSLERLLVQGRWASSRTARINIEEGLAVSAELKLAFPHTHNGNVNRATPASFIYTLLLDDMSIATIIEL